MNIIKMMVNLLYIVIGLDDKYNIIYMYAFYFFNMNKYIINIIKY